MKHVPVAVTALTREVLHVVHRLTTHALFPNPTLAHVQLRPTIVHAALDVLTKTIRVQAALVRLVRHRAVAFQLLHVRAATVVAAMAAVEAAVAEASVVEAEVAEVVASAAEEAVEAVAADKHPNTLYNR